MIKRIPFYEAREGDILTFEGKGLVFNILSRIIKWRVPTWDKRHWHMTPVIRRGLYELTILDAQWPKIKLNRVGAEDGEGIRAYRIFESPPPNSAIAGFVNDRLGCWYDIVVYLLTAAAILLRPCIDVPRIINRRFDCWEIAFDFCDCMGEDITPSYQYPFLTDFLRLAGEC